MTSFFINLGKKLPKYFIDDLIYTMNPYKTLNKKILNTNQGWFCVYFHNNAPLKGNKYFEDENWIAVFAGDLIEDSLNWNFIIDILKYGNYEKLTNFDGYFSITILDKKKNELFIISDRRSQFPVFYIINNVDIYVSTELSTFCRLPIDVQFNLEWLWEYLFFNFPVGQTTFLKNVKRMPPASVLKIDLNSGEYIILKYAKNFHKKENLLKKKESLKHAHFVFSNIMNKYFLGADNIACALTGGWDGRTNLSFCPNINSTVAYTYGVPGCLDLLEASKTAQHLNIQHCKIFFDEDFERELPNIIFDTVYISSGLERITRATLLYMYKNLTNYGTKFPLIISGISLDMQFRGHAHVPALISHDMAEIFFTGKKNINENYWKERMGNHYESFKRHILNQIDNLEKEYGKLSEPEAHLSYVLYEISPKHFAGELAIAKHFTTVRIPAWDQDIIDLSYSIKNSTLSFSQFLAHHKRGSIEEIILQAYLISKNKLLRDVPVHGVPPKVFAQGKSIYNLIYAHVYRIKNLLPQAIKRIVLKRPYSPLENWNKWLEENLKGIITPLIFTENSRIKNYINSEYINLSEKDLSDRFIRKLITVEIILKLFLSNKNNKKNDRKE